MWWLFSGSFVPSLALFGLLVYLIYKYGTNTYDYWEKKGVPYMKPKYPYLGTLYDVAFSLKTNHQKQIETYNYFKGEKIGGVFLFKKPVLVINDIKLAEHVMVKDFTSFYNRANSSGTLKQEPLGAHLLNLEDSEWKSLRQKLSPAFSSGKLKGMHQQLVDCSEELIKYISNHVEKCEPMEVREVMAKLTTDVIGSCAFGLSTNALQNPESEFRKMGRKIFQPSILLRLRFLIRSQYPLLVKWLSWRTRNGPAQRFFVTMLQSTMSHREKNKVFRNDFVQLLMELKQQDLGQLNNGSLDDDKSFIIDDHVIASNAFVFFVAGFETTASTLSYCIYELSLHQKIQEEAYQHVVDVLKNHSGEVTYEAVKDMHFIQQVFAETLRMHSPASELRRVATRDYVIPGTSVTLTKGSLVSVPLYALHNDPKYFPEPEKFKPERFDPNKNTIQKGSYLPFGNGPRICIGKRFAEMEMQVAMVKLLLNYRFTLNSKTVSPLVYNPSSLLLTPIGGIWIDFQKRI